MEGRAAREASSGLKWGLVYGETKLLRWDLHLYGFTNGPGGKSGRKFG